MLQSLGLPHKATTGRTGGIARACSIGLTTIRCDLEHPEKAAKPVQRNLSNRGQAGPSSENRKDVLCRQQQNKASTRQAAPNL